MSKKIKSEVDDMKVKIKDLRFRLKAETNVKLHKTYRKEVARLLTKINDKHAKPVKAENVVENKILDKK